MQERAVVSKSGPKRLRELLNQPGLIRSLGAHDVFTALIVEQAGFETVFIGGFGCDEWKKTGRVDQLATQAMTFAEVKKLLGVEEFLRLHERL